MRPARVIKLGEKFLKGVSVEDLKSMQAREKDYKVKTMLQAAMHRERGLFLEEISKAIGNAISTIHGWLSRLENGMEGRHDLKSPGRPCRLSDEQISSLDKDLEKNPEKSGFHRSTWTAKLVVRHVLDKFGVRYSADDALRLARRLNFPVRKPRPVPYNSATKEEVEKYVNDTVREIKAHAERGYKVVCLDAAALIDSPLSRRGIRRRGGRDTVKMYILRSKTYSGTDHLIRHISCAQRHGYLGAYNMTDYVVMVQNMIFSQTVIRFWRILWHSLWAPSV